MFPINKRPDRHYIPLYLYLLFWFTINLFFLNSFPFFHTDEAWLSGLTRTMMGEGRPDSTEAFFDLYERHPHAIKLLYHLAESLFFVFDYSLFSARLLSLTVGALTLWCFHHLLTHLSPSPDRTKTDGGALLVTVFFSWDVQFVYATHMARQEIFILLFLLIGLLLFYGGDKGTSGRKSFPPGLTAGLAFGIHPNALLTLFPLFFLFTISLLNHSRNRWDLLSFLLGLVTGIFPFLLLSFLFNIHFPRDYLAFGQTVGVTEGLDVKLLKWPQFHNNLYHRIGGTYYLPDIRYFYAILPLLALILACMRIRGKALFFSGLLGISLGTLLLGKYSPPSQVLLFPFFYLGLYLIFDRFRGRSPGMLSFLLLIIALSSSLWQIGKEAEGERNRYRDYREEISRWIPEDGRVLGGLTLVFYLNRGKLYDWRNLAFLRENNLTLEEYLADREIGYVIIPSELFLIHENRPVWNSLYGNTSYWFPRLMEILEQRGELIYRFDTPGYGTRIAAYRYRIPEYTLIYRLDREASSRE